MFILNIFNAYMVHEWNENREVEGLRCFLVEGLLLFSVSLIEMKIGLKLCELLYIWKESLFTKGRFFISQL